MNAQPPAPAPQRRRNPLEILAEMGSTLAGLIVAVLVLIVVLVVIFSSGGSSTLAFTKRQPFIRHVDERIARGELPDVDSSFDAYDSGRGCTQGSNSFYVNCQTHGGVAFAVNTEGDTDGTVYAIVTGTK